MDPYQPQYVVAAPAGLGGSSQPVVALYVPPIQTQALSVSPTQTQAPADPEKSKLDKAKEKAMQLAGKGKEKGKEMLEVGKEKAQEYSEKGKEQAKETVLAAYEKLNDEQKAWVLDKVDAGRRFKDTQSAKMDEMKEKFEAKIAETVEEQKVKLELMVVERVGPYIDKAMDIGKKEIIQLATDDPYMPLLVKESTGGLIDGIWPDVVEEVKIELFNALRKTIDTRPDPAPHPFFWLRAKFRYIFMPFDRSFWRQIRTFGFWFFLIISLIPWFGIRTFYYTLVLCLIDLGDEFQLMCYIQSFKAMQFISGGLVAGTLGGFQYYACVNFTPEHHCHEKIWGPGQADNFLTQMMSFFGQMLLVWLAFMLLPCSVQKGRRRFKNQTNDERLHSDVEEANESWGAWACCGIKKYQFPSAEAERAYRDRSAMKRERRRRLFWLLVVDIASALVVMGLFAAAFVVKVYDGTWDGFSSMDMVQSWQFKADFYWCRILYCLFSFFFFVLNLPILNRAISNSPPTGYSSNGTCLPLQSPKPLPLETASSAPVDVP